nr:hypothetical protein [Anaerolineae bacterium]
GSGYAKEIIWKFIKRYDLREDHIHKLEEAAFQYLSRPMSREFKLMCQTMSRIATASFWDKVKSELGSDNPIIQINSYCLYAYSEGIIAGEKQRLYLKKVKRSLRWYVSDRSEDYSVEELFSLLEEPENWPEGKIKYQEPKPEDLPIVYYDPEYDKKFASLNIALSHKKIIEEKLSTVLSSGTLHGFNATTWLYAVYLLGKIDDPSVIKILAKFWNQKVDYKFEGITKSIARRSVFNALKNYETSEAIALIKDYEQIVRENTE